MTLPDIPRLYTALAEVLAVLVYAQAAPCLLYTSDAADE